MNYWTQRSIEMAMNEDYLDRLFAIYSFGVDEEREPISKDKWNRIEQAYDNNDNCSLVRELLSLEKFPINNPYVGYFRKDDEAIERNPQLIFRLADKIRGFTKDELKRRCLEPKSNSRQMGQKFKDWLTEEHLGVRVVNSISEFTVDNNDAVLKGTDADLLSFAREHLGYTKDKGFDFLARVNGVYVIGEAKFITNYGGTQDEQFEDACSTADLNLADVKTIAIVDGVPYIQKQKMRKYKTIFNDNPDRIVVSALLLKEYLDSLRIIS